MYSKNLLYSLCFIIGNSWASQKIASGVINFQGAIVSDGCQLKIDNISDMYLICFYENKKVSKNVNVKSLNGHYYHSDTPIKTAIEYIDKEHKLAIVNVSYE